MSEPLRRTAFETIDDHECRLFVKHLELVGRRWAGAVLLAGVRGARRFSEYRAVVDGISDRLLSLRLKELEAEGFLVRVVTPTTPVSITYVPTSRGRDLLAALQPLAQWAHDDERRSRLRSVSG